MKILISITYYSPNISGLTIYAKTLAEELVKRGYEVIVLTSQHKKDLPLEEFINGVKVIRVPVTLQIGKGPIMFSLPLQAIKLIAWTDVVNCHLPQFESSLITVIAKLLRKRVILTHHTDLSGWEGFFNRISEATVFISQFIAASLADAITVYTEDYANHSSFLRLFKQKLIFIYPPVKSSPIDGNFKKILKEKIGNASFIIGFSGRIARQKGLPYLFNSIPYLKDKIKDFKIVLAGPYKEVIGENTIDSLEPLINKYKNNVVLLGPIAPDEMSTFYSLIDVLVLPSDDRLESFGFVQIEAMLVGCPVVATNLPGVRIPIIKTGMGELVESKNPNLLADAIIKLLTHKDRYIKVREKIRNVFNLKNSIEIYEKLFQN